MSYFSIIKLKNMRFHTRKWVKPEDLNPLRLKTIAHFFEHYKDLEEGKWVKILGWEGPESAKQEILDGIANYQKEQQ